VGEGPKKGRSAQGRLVALLLDTTVLIDYLRGAPAADRIDEMLARGDLACTTAINVEEIVRGLRPRERAQAARLVEGLVVIPLEAKEGWKAGSWRGQFAIQGPTLSQADCLIAAAALSAGATLATGNPRDFPMSDINLEHWPVGA
jgi:predicted nucleic acid-binding protein